MGEELYTILAAWQAMDLAGLKAEWKARWKEDAPAARRNDLHRRMAWRLQSEALGDIRPEVRALIDRHVGGEEGAASPVKVRRRQGMTPGTRLRRRWRGTVYEVEVAPDGFRWEGQIYRTLTAVACEITGTQRNGPRFFGLRKEGQ